MTVTPAENKTLPISVKLNKIHQEPQSPPLALTLCPLTSHQVSRATRGTFPRKSELTNPQAPDSKPMHHGPRNGDLSIPGQHIPKSIPLYEAPRPLNYFPGLVSQGSLPL